MPTFYKTTETYRPGARTLPGRYYTSPDIFAEERERIFRRHWHCVGRGEQIARPGDYFLCEIAGDSLIVLRDGAGAVRAHFNVCRHRGTRLCEASEGQFSETIQCPYHAWTYRLDGRLIGAPHMNEVEGFDKNDYPLHQAAVAEWEGFLFVNLARDPEPLARILAPLDGRFTRFGLPALRRVHRVDYEVRANWKLIFQNYSECLHCPVIHPELASVLPYTSGANDLVEGLFLGGHMTLTPPHQSATLSGRLCAVPFPGLDPDDRRRAYYYSIFPNLLLSLHPDYVIYYQVWPRGPDRTAIRSEWLFHPEAIGRPDFRPDDAIGFWDVTNRQDWRICELSQAGIASSAYTPGPYSPRESIPAAWDRAYLAVMEHEGL
ncbi:MAG TPA: aromatic ring-hydroxylating dioxygenase subunit alpha [Gemmatimonadales bacterium]|nr:aromatic ring-hydroxylating dioxygenase subunit alpha [Gemmatimonadales bacterium]